jgi:hypothetical protein
MPFLNVKSMAKITKPIITEEIITKIAEDCNSDHVGQVTLFINSLYDSSKYILIFDIKSFFAREAGLEPTANGFGDHYSTN